MNDILCRLEITSGGETRFIEIDKASFVLGRGDSADVKVGSSGVSRTHLNVEITDSKITVKDLNSANGTRLNGKKLTPGQAVAYHEGDSLNLGLADDVFKITLVEPADEFGEIKLPPLPDMKPKAPRVEIPAVQKVALPPEIPKVKVSPPLPARTVVPPLESTIVDPEFHKMGKLQNHLATEEIMEEARAAALKLKIAAEAQAAKIVQDATEKILIETSKAKDKAEAMIAEASDQAYKVQRQGEAEVAKMREGMQESLNKLNKEFEARSQELLKEARAAANLTKAAAQQEADKITSQAYQKASEIKNLGEAELKNFLKDEKQKAEQIIADAQAEADKILHETRAAAGLLRKNLERELEETKAQAMMEANLIRTEALHEGEQEAAKLKAEGQKQAELAMSKAEKLIVADEIRIKDMLAVAEKDASEIKGEAQKLAEVLLERTRETIHSEESRIKELAVAAERDAAKILADAQRNADAILERSREKNEIDRQKIIEGASEEAEKLKADAARAAKKESQNLLRLAENDRSELTQAVQKLGQDIIQLEKKKVDLSTGNKSLQKRNLELQAEVDDTKSKLVQEAALLATKVTELENNAAEAKKVAEMAGLAEESIRGVREERKNLLKRIEALKEDEEKLNKSFEVHLMQIEADKIRSRDALNAEVAEAKATAMSEVKVLREKAQQDFENKKNEQTEELSRMRLTELGIIKGLRAEEESRFNAARKHHVLEISKALETYVIPRLKESLNWAEVPKPLENFFVDVKDIVENVFEGQFSSQVANTAMDISNSKPKKSLKRRNAMILAGAALAAVAIISTVPMENQGRRKPASEVFLDKLKQKEALKPKFDPKITEDYKNSYTDNVIYTKDYATFKLNPDNQGPWIKELNKFFMNNLALNENAIVSFISVEQSLVGQLKDLRAVIHLENQKEDIKKMTDAEAASVSEMVSILGGPEKYQAFRQFEKDYFTKSRQPASQPIVTGP